MLLASPRDAALLALLGAQMHRALIAVADTARRVFALLLGVRSRKAACKQFFADLGERVERSKKFAIAAPSEAAHCHRP